MRKITLLSHIIAVTAVAAVITFLHATESTMMYARLPGIIFLPNALENELSHLLFYDTVLAVALGTLVLNIWSLVDKPSKAFRFIGKISALLGLFTALFGISAVVALHQVFFLTPPSFFIFLCSLMLFVALNTFALFFVHSYETSR